MVVLFVAYGTFRRLHVWTPAPHAPTSNQWSNHFFPNTSPIERHWPVQPRDRIHRHPDNFQSWPRRPGSIVGLRSGSKRRSTERLGIGIFHNRRTTAPPAKRPAAQQAGPAVPPSGSSRPASSLLSFFGETREPIHCMIESTCTDDRQLGEISTHTGQEPNPLRAEDSGSHRMMLVDHTRASHSFAIRVCPLEHPDRRL